MFDLPHLTQRSSKAQHKYNTPLIGIVREKAKPDLTATASSHAEGVPQWVPGWVPHLSMVSLSPEVESRQIFPKEDEKWSYLYYRIIGKTDKYCLSHLLGQLINWLLTQIAKVNLWAWYHIQQQAADCLIVFC